MPDPVLSGTALARREAALATLGGLFAEAGYAAVAPRHLLDADVLLDLYGEDVRTRAFLFPDPVRGTELCLRPDFTVPVAMAHGAGGWERAAAYAYQGPVFRLQEAETRRPTEYFQAGIERYGDADAAAADAAVLALVLTGLEALGVTDPQVSTGDPGVAFALLDALEMPPHRRTALRRHFWRPRRFRALIQGYMTNPPVPGPRRAALLAAVAESPERAMAMAERSAVLGLRGLEEIAGRARSLADAAAEPPMASPEARLIEAVLAVRGPSGEALARLRTLTAEADVDIGPALEHFERRVDALNRIGIDGEELPFDAGFGRNMEYYDGFVFEVTSPGHPGLPPLAGGGRYDRMTRRLGAARPVPAVGAMIRPEAALAASGEPS